MTAATAKQIDNSFLVDMRTKIPRNQEQRAAKAPSAGGENLKRVRHLVTCLPLVLLTGCFDLCDYQDKREYESPGRGFTASIYNYDCGATTSFLTHVSLRSKNSRFDPNSGVIFLVRNRPAISLTWRSETELLVHCSECAQNDIGFREQAWRDVRITFDTSQ